MSETLNSSQDQDETLEANLISENSKEIQSLLKSDVMNFKATEKKEFNYHKTMFQLAKKISLNKHPTGIYHKGEDKFSSNTNTIGSLFGVLIILIFMIV